MNWICVVQVSVAPASRVAKQMQARYILTFYTCTEGGELNLWLGKIFHSSLNFENWNKKKEHFSRTGGYEDVTKLYDSLFIMRVLLL